MPESTSTYYRSWYNKRKTEDPIWYFKHIAKARDRYYTKKMAKEREKEKQQEAIMKKLNETLDNLRF